MRFESKHSFFKNVIRRMQNFINVSKSLAEKLELQQSFVRLGAYIRPEEEYIEMFDFNPQFYHTGIITCIKIMKLQNDLTQCTSVIVKGTKYS